MYFVTNLLSVCFDFCAEAEEPPLLGTSRPDDWLAAHIAGFTSRLQIYLSFGSDFESLHLNGLQKLKPRHFGEVSAPSTCNF